MSQRDIIVLAGYLVRCPLGGYAWQVLHYVAGLRALGFDAYFYEDTAFYCGSYDPVSDSDNVGTANGIAFTSDLFRRFGLEDAWMFWDAQADLVYGAQNVDRQDLLNRARVVITLAPVTRLPRRGKQSKVFIDLDPGFTQIRADRGDAAILELLNEHDVHFTFGENIGHPQCSVPSAGLRWLPTRQPVVLDFWEPGASAADAAFTTVGKWNEKRRDVELDGEMFAWCKRTEWMKFLSLPARSGQRFQPGLDTHNVAGDTELLRANGWDPVDPIEVSRDALRYRDFIRASKGEFTVAKDLNVRLRSGWFSDRGACYLAAGRPVVTQDTGFDTVLPTGRGLFGVRTVAEAVDAFAQIDADYEAQRLAARAIAEQCFDARRVLRDLMSHL